ncbi:MAG: radical SAM/SPASM domain-containing protein [Candidatus Heimdallarchaeota archaeon]
MVSNSLKKRIQTILNLPGTFLSSERPLVFDLNVISTNKCNQNCPMCNADLQHKTNPMTMSLRDFKLFEHMLRQYRIPVCSISGGEPTLVPDMPKIIDYAAECFPFGVSILTNLFASPSRIKRVMESALRNNIVISTSFDGFGEVADILRHGRNVSERVAANMEMVSEMRREMDSSSTLTCHTVISDLNVNQIPEIAAFSRKLGWTQSIAPINNFDYLSKDGEMPKLSYSPELIKSCQHLLEQPHLTQLHSFIREIPNYTRMQSPKLCPYLSRVLKTFKLFLEPNGDVSLCDRVPIGNIRKVPLHSMFEGAIYDDRLRAFQKCEGCWLACFVEPFLALKPENLVRLDFLNRLPRSPDNGNK